MNGKTLGLAAQATIGLSLLAAASAAQVPTPYDLVDDAGAPIGRVLDVNAFGGDISRVHVSADLNGQPVVLTALGGNLIRSTFSVSSPTSRVFFLTTDCTGQAYVVQDPNNPFAPLSVVGGPPDFTVYLAPVGAPLVPIDAQSYLQSSDPCVVQASSPDAYAANPIPLTRVGPFRVESAFGAGVLAVPAADRWGLAALAVALGAVAAWWLAKGRRAARAA